MKQFLKPLAAAAMFAALAATTTVSIADTITEWDLKTVPAEQKAVDDAVSRFKAANSGTDVQSVHTLNDAYKTKLKIAFGAGDPPCVFASWGGGVLHEYVKAGQVVDLTPYLDKNPQFKNKFLPQSWQNVTFDNKIYGVAADNTSIATIFYNKELFAKYNLQPPKTWDDLVNVIKVLKSHDVAPFALANKNKWTGSMYFMTLADRIGGPQPFINAVNRSGSFEDPTFIEAGKRLQELVKMGAFAPGFNGLDYDTGAQRRLLYADKAAMELIGSWEISAFKSENPEFYKKVGTFAFPTVPGGKGDPKDVIGTVGDNFWSISKSCKNPDAAFKLIQTLDDDQSVKDHIATGRVPPIKGARGDEPIVNNLLDEVAQAPSVQLWYDQLLPPQLGELHKDTTQALFGLTMTPEQAAAKMEAQAKTELK
ncbi:MAG TPA: extracellular solute-binding protein [Pararobbsia sp.]|jgi:raffinose/stachyose/melibiose transport system substrate-binding protein|nr:extracellular solute-binding protein [Pararobbsia sp.]